MQAAFQCHSHLDCRDLRDAPLLASAVTFTGADSDELRLLTRNFAAPWSGFSGGRTAVEATRGSWAVCKLITATVEK